MATASSKGDDLVALRLHANNFHPGRSERHPGHGQASDAAGSLRERPPHVGYRNMALEWHTIDDRRMARAKIGRYADPALQGDTVGVINDPDFATELLTNLR